MDFNLLSSSFTFWLEPPAALTLEEAAVSRAEAALPLRALNMVGEEGKL